MKVSRRSSAGGQGVTVSTDSYNVENTNPNLRGTSDHGREKQSYSTESSVISFDSHVLRTPLLTLAKNNKFSEIMRVLNCASKSDIQAWVDAAEHGEGETEAIYSFRGQPLLHSILKYRPPVEVIKALTIFVSKRGQILLPEETMDIQGRNPLHTAAGEGCDIEVIKRLMSIGYKFANTADSMGRYPLHYACANPHGNPSINRGHVLRMENSQNMMNVVRLLLRGYPDAVTSEDKEGNTPIDLAKQHKADSALMKVLKNAAASRPANRRQNAKTKNPIAFFSECDFSESSEHSGGLGKSVHTAETEALTISAHSSRGPSYTFTNSLHVVPDISDDDSVSDSSIYTTDEDGEEAGRTSPRSTATDPSKSCCKKQEPKEISITPKFGTNVIVFDPSKCTSDSNKSESHDIDFAPPKSKSNDIRFGNLPIFDPSKCGKREDPRDICLTPSKHSTCSKEDPKEISFSGFGSNLTPQKNKNPKEIDITGMVNYASPLKVPLNQTPESMKRFLTSFKEDCEEEEQQEAYFDKFECDNDDITHIDITDYDSDDCSSIGCFSVGMNMMQNNPPQRKSLQKFPKVSRLDL